MAKLYRSEREKVIAGVCGGIGLYFRMDPTIVRLLAIFGACMTAIVPFILAYLFAWFFIPVSTPEPKAPIFRRIVRSSSDKKLAGICGGIAKQWDLDSTFVRIAAVVLGVCTGGLPLVLTYIAGIFLIPDEETLYP